MCPAEGESYAASMNIAQNVQNHLRSLGADFEVVDIDPDLADTATFCEQYGYSPGESANAILIASKRPAGRFSVCVALATTRLDVNHRVRDLMEVKKLSFADPDTTRELTGMMIGGVTPFGLPPELPVFVDSAVSQLDRVIVGGGDRATKIIVGPDVLSRVPNVSVIDGLAQPIS